MSSSRQPLSSVFFSTRRRLLAALGGLVFLLLAAGAGRAGEDPGAELPEVPDPSDLGVFIRGDANGDGDLDISDAVANLGCQFLGGRCPGCMDVLDVDDSGEVTITDPIGALNFLFRGGEAPAPPFPDPGPDPTADAMECAASALQVTLDPDMDLSAGVDIEALQEEARGTGLLSLRNGEVLEGRVVSEGLHIPDDAEVYLMPGTQIVSVGDAYFGGSLVPMEDPNDEANDELNDLEADGAEDEVLDAEDALGGGGAGARVSRPQPAYPLDCPAVTRKRAVDKGTMRGVEIEVLGSARVTRRTFARWCDGSRDLDAEPVRVVGAKSASAEAGRARGGRDLTLELISFGGSRTLTIEGTICNQRGGNGGDATATGAAGVGCGECGGDTFAVGGEGGRSGTLRISAPRMVFGRGSSIDIRAGGRGGDATATGGDGGDCDECGLPGGEGGSASAVGGAAGAPGGAYIAANEFVDAAGLPLTAAAVMAGATIAPGARGGDATATAGTGGDAGGDCDCAEPPGRGGDGGSADAKGGKGGKGVKHSSYAGRTLTGVRTTDGGPGGIASATGKDGGVGGDAADCPCDETVQAASGGDGGDGGAAGATGGAGGDATWGAPGVGAAPTAGNGGAATAACGDGGDAGDGGSCVGPEPLRCSPGAGGDGGTEGGETAANGAPGTPAGGAAPGAPGVATSTGCDPGADGDPGAVSCDPPPPPPPVDDAGACLDDLEDLLESLPGIPPPAREELLALLRAAREALARGAIAEALALLEELLRRLIELMEFGEIAPNVGQPLITRIEGCRALVDNTLDANGDPGDVIGGDGGDDVVVIGGDGVVDDGAGVRPGG